MRNIQATGDIYGKTVSIKQISKVRAKQLFEAGKEIYLQSCNMSPFNMWQAVYPVKKDIDYTNVYDASNFESIVNNYSYYNCDNERGKYVTFYANKTDL